MARAWLSDDAPTRGRAAYASPGGWKAGLDDDPGLATAEWGAAADGSPALVDDEWKLDTVLLMIRTPAAVDDDGNAVWDWISVYAGPAVVTNKQRIEVDDAAGSVALTATVAVPYPTDQPNVSETGVVVDSVGRPWNIESSTRVNDGYTFKVRAVGVADADLGATPIPDPNWPELFVPGAGLVLEPDPEHPGLYLWRLL